MIATCYNGSPVSGNELLLDFGDTVDDPKKIAYKVEITEVGDENGDGAINLAQNLIAEDGSIAMRITREEFSKQLCYRFQKPIVSTSANISGELTAQNYCDISQEIIDAVDYVCWTRRQEHKPHKPSCIIKLSAESEVTIIRK